MPYLYLIISLLNLFAVYTNNDTLRFATKPLLMVILSFYFWQSSQPMRGFSFWILLGLVLSISGDTWLLWDTENCFLAGLVSFLLAHIFYLVGFLKYKPHEQGFLTNNKWAVFPYLLFWVGMNYGLRNHLGEMQIPVLIYSGVIVAMAVAATNFSTKTDAGMTVLWGVWLFMFSDMIIAFNKFMPDLGIPQPNFIIMLTYLLGQWLIAKGSIAAHQEI